MHDIQIPQIMLPNDIMRKCYDIVLREKNISSRYGVTKLY